MSCTCSELTWLRYLLIDPWVSHPQPVLLFCDNQLAFHIAPNPIFYQKIRHIELDCHLIRDKIQESSIITSHILSQFQLANIFIKALLAYLLNFHLYNMRIVNFYSSSYGRLLYSTNSAQVQDNTSQNQIQKQAQVPTYCSDAYLIYENGQFYFILLVCFYSIICIYISSISCFSIFR